MLTDSRLDHLNNHSSPVALKERDHQNQKGLSEFCGNLFLRALLNPLQTGFSWNVQLKGNRNIMTQGQTRGQFPRKRRCDEGSKTWAWRGQTDWAPQIRTNLYEICVASNLTRNLWQLLNTAQYGLAPCECVPLSDDSRVRKWGLPSTRGGCLCRRSEH